jgi:hypothetical protein
MALSVSMDSAFQGDAALRAGVAHGMHFSVGRITGSWGGVLESFTLGGMNTPMYVVVPPVSGYMFSYNPLDNHFAVLVETTTDAGSQQKFASYSTSIDLSCFTMYFNGKSTVGVGYLAIGY